MNADLHCHSTVSDGVLAPDELALRAFEKGVELWALTDHDDTSGLDLARAAAEEIGMGFVPGVEISVTWRGPTIHVLGLGVDAQCRELDAGLAGLRAGRAERAQRIGAQLEKLGSADAYTGALSFAPNPDMIGRTHFARLLVQRGLFRDVQAAFDAYLKPGRPAYVPHTWAELGAAVQWINRAGGVAVLAHPLRYRLSGTELFELCGQFVDVGGTGIEVVSGRQSPQFVSAMAKIARHFDLDASRGSDFHAPAESGLDLGEAPPLPDDLRPIWRWFL
ncbi:MAG: PHP domain-containing protein [Rhodocyclaceae bacterium]|nr:PHP domain-containing protein [Rhodocyclaceae bacterium]MBX3666998.1 PHP domain-containing protein [Rhodocyclaceae bacterium]